MWRVPVGWKAGLDSPHLFYDRSAMKAFLALLIAAPICIVVPYDSGDYYSPYGYWGYGYHGHNRHPGDNY